MPDLPDSFQKIVKLEKKFPLPVRQQINYWNNPCGRARLERRKKILLDRFQKARRVLEVGCGVGIMTGALGENEKALVRSDLIFQPLEHGKKIGTFEKKEKLLSADIHRLPFKEASFDGVFGNAMLHHVKVSVALKELHRVLKKGSSLVFFEPNMANPIVWAIKHNSFLGKKMHETPGETAFYREELERLAREAGFNKVDVKHYDFCIVPPFLVDAMKNWEKKLENSFFKKMSFSLILTAEK
jgi:ubiquinone/menaquinone biosynthesis C-methylase UbiE